MSDDLNTEIKIGADASGVEAGVGRAKRSLKDLGDAAQKTGKQGADGMKGIGAGAENSAKKVESATRSTIASLQRQIAAMEAGDKTSRKYQETLARMRGVDVAKLKPYLDQLDSLKVKTSLAERAQASFNSAMFKVTAVLAATAAITAYGRSIVDGIDAMNDLADATGASIENISALDRVARETGGNFDSVSSSLVKFNMVLKDADPSKGAGAVLKALNLDIAELKALDPAEAMRQVAVALEGYANSGDKARAIQELFGKSIKDAAPFLKDLAESGRLNATVTKEQADQAERFNKELFKLSANSLDAGRSLTINLVTAMNTIIESFREGEKASNSFFAGYWGGVRGFYEATGIMDKAVKGSRSVSGGILDLTNQADAETARLSRGAPPRMQLQIPADKIKGGRGSSAGSNAAASALKAEQSAYESLMTSIRTKIELDKAELAGNAALTESQQMRVKLDADMVGGRLKLSAAHEQEIRAALNSLSASEALMKSRKLEIEQAEAYAKTIESRQISAASVSDQIAALQQEAKASEMVRTMKISEAEAIEILNIARLREKAAIIGLFDPHAQELVYLKDEIAQREKLTGMLGQKRVVDTATTAAEAAADEWKKTAENIESALTDALMRGFESGKSFGENLGDSISNYFKTTVAKEIAAAITRAIMSAMASTQWGQMLSGALGGGGGGGNWMSMASNAYSAYSSGAAGGAGAVGGSASAVGSYVGGSMSYANAYGSIYANTTGTGINGLLATNGAYGTAGAGGAAGSGAASSIGYLGYAALIAAAVLIAENLYEKGYNRAAVGYGDSSTVKFGQNTIYTADNSMGRSTVYDTSFERFKSNMLEGLGMSEKWVDILSGTTRMATLFGRKLSAYGYEANIAGGDAEVGGFARYKGGVFRSNKTVKAEVDPRDAAAFDAVVENTIEGSKAMARALGLSDDAINKYTGSLKVNFKGAKTAEEQAERMAKAMDELQYSLLKAASGGKYSREELDKMIEAAQASMAAVGITTAGIADILVQGMTGRLSQADVGDRLSEVIVGGIYNAIAGQYAGQIASVFTSQIIQPIFTAIAAGVPISQAISQTAIQNVVATAQNAAAALNAVFSDPSFRQAIAGIESAISSVSVSVTRVRAPAYGGRVSRNTAAQQAAQKTEQERYQLETQLLTILGNTTRLRERELAGLSAGNRELQIRIWALEDAKSAVESAMGALERSIEAQRDTVQKQLDAALESESMLNDVFDTLRENIRELRGDVTSTAGMGAAEGRSKILQAISGAITLNNDDLSEAIEAVRDSLDNQAFASKFERDRATLAFAGELDSLAGGTEQSLSAAEQTVTLLEDQLTALDSALELAQKQVDALFGVDTSVKTVANAVMALKVSMAGYAAAVASAQAVATSGGAAPSSGGGSSGGGGRRSSAPRPAAQWTAAGYWSKNIDLQREYAYLINLDPGETDPRFTKDEKLSYRDEYLAWHWANYGKTEKRRYAKGGYYPGGMALVGEEGPELINFKKPGQVYTARQTADLMRGDGANSEVVKELRELRSEQRAQASAMVGVQMKLNKIVSRWDAAGMPEVRVLA